MPEWRRSSEAWLAYEEQLAPDAWLYVCKRPPGFNWKPHKWYCHVYVFSRPVSPVNGGTGANRILAQYSFEDESPMEMYCALLEAKKQFGITS